MATIKHREVRGGGPTDDYVWVDRCQDARGSELMKKFAPWEILLGVFTLAYVNTSVWAWVHVNSDYILTPTIMYIVASFLLIIYKDDLDCE